MNNLLKDFIPKENIFNSKNNNINDKGFIKILEEKQSKIYEEEARKLGIDIINLTKHFENTEELLTRLPTMVTAEVLINSIMKTQVGKIELKKGDVYIMSFSTYINAYRDKLRGSQVMKPYKKQFCKYFNRYKGQNLSNKSLLICRTGGIGDIIFSQPIVKYLRKQYPSCKITFATAAQNSGIFKCWEKGLVNRVIHIPFLRQELSKHDYHLFFEGAIEKNKEAEKENCYNIFKKMAFLDFDINEFPIKLVPDKNIVDKVKKFVPDNTIMIQVRASSNIRVMSSNNWKVIINKLEELGYNVAIIDSKKASDVYEVFKQEQQTPNLINLAKYSEDLDYGVAMVSLCKGMITIDSSFSHIAPALGIPTIGIYGPFIGDVRMRYYKNSDWVDSNEYKECGLYPCFFHQHTMNSCPFIQRNALPGCLSSINPDLVIEKFKKIIEKIQ